MEHQQALWAKGWLPGFVREEAALGSGESTCNDISSGQLRGPEAPRVYTAGKEAARYASFSNGPYSAVWLLTRAQLEAFVADPSRVYAAGYSEFDTRARMSWGFMYARARDGSLVPRVLVPLVGGGGEVDPRAHVLHLPSNYCGKQTGWEACVSFAELNGALGQTPVSELGVHPALPCSY